MRALICRVRGHDDEVRARYSDRWGSGTAWRCRRCGRPRRATSVSVSMAGLDRLVKETYAPALRAMLAEPSPLLRYLATSTDTPTLTPAEQAEREQARARAQALADVADEWGVTGEVLDLLDERDWY